MVASGASDAGIDLGRRAEELAPADFIRLADALARASEDAAY
jgi:16S rRNA A1518/A1519 N6-dimethyltransferase RsmA/KsgA/DIM1 with predicted DNA glycosylase/AP lyase activity